VSFMDRQSARQRDANAVYPLSGGAISPGVRHRRQRASYTSVVLNCACMYLVGRSVQARKTDTTNGLDSTSIRSSVGTGEGHIPPTLWVPELQDRHRGPGRAAG
jgi:hypothetical protein